LAINRATEISKSRTDLCPEDEYLQICTKVMEAGTTFKPHRHNKLIRTTDITQEAWIILKGKVAATFWDLNDSIIYETNLSAGDCAVVFKAGHSFEVIEDDTILYEVKTGPYYGVEKDKTFIGKKYEI
jgi:cupin fold WbuC family metalloprotein